VIGTLPLAERMAFEARLKAEPALQALVASWEAQLSALNDDYADVPAPNLLPRIEARLFPAAIAAPAPRRSLWSLWPGVLGGLVAGILVLAVALQFLPAPGALQPDLVAHLAGEGQAVAFDVSYDADTDEMTLVQVAGSAAPEGQDYEMWVIGTSGVPVSLGVIPAGGGTMTVPELQADFVLAVSLEAKGGSVTGAPAVVLVTGAVVSL
jgi:anti-sigma-K factor RskA